MSFARPDQQAQDSRPAPGPHLLDVSMLWGAAGSVRRVLMAKHERLRTMGWRHTVVAPGASGPGVLDCGGLPLPGSGGHRLVLGRGRALRQMLFAAPDLIESADPGVLGWATLTAAERLGVPAVAFCHGDLSAPVARLGPGTQRWAQRYLVNFYRHFDLVMAPSTGLARRLQTWGVPRVSVQPLGLDCSVFTPRAQDAAWRAQFCRDHGLRPDTRLLIYAGRFSPEKNLQLLAEAVALLGRDHVLLAVGNGPAAPVGPQVVMLPPAADSRQLARMVASCDAYVDAGSEDACDMGVLEAMACGTPVVAANAAEVADGAGLLVQSARSGCWAEALEASLAGNNTAQRRTALARAQQQDWPRVLTQLTHRYTTLLHRPVATPAAPQRLHPWAGQLARQR